MLPTKIITQATRANNQKTLKLLIEEHKIIIIHRHKNPDGDAIGSQVGLASSLKELYPNKIILQTGDINNRIFHAKMDNIEDDLFTNALIIILDTSVHELVSDSRYAGSKTIVIIDHHLNETDINNVTLFYHEPSYASTGLIVADFLRYLNVKLNSEAALYLYYAIVSDSGRFLYLNDNIIEKTFEITAYVAKYVKNIESLYEFLYVEPLVNKKAKAMFADFETTIYNVAYRKNTFEMVKASGLDAFAVSRGMVNNMANIKEILIWVNFTESENGEIQAEIRSRGVHVLDIAKKYGGGGHAQACGAKLSNFAEADAMLDDLNNLLK